MAMPKSDVIHSAFVKHTSLAKQTSHTKCASRSAKAEHIIEKGLAEASPFSVKRIRKRWFSYFWFLSNYTDIDVRFQYKTQMLVELSQIQNLYISALYRPLTV